MAPRTDGPRYVSFGWEHIFSSGAQGALEVLVDLDQQRIVALRDDTGRYYGAVAMEDVEESLRDNVDGDENLARALDGDVDGLHPLERETYTFHYTLPAWAEEG